MLTLYRRHAAACPKKSDRYWKRCTCAMWVEGTTSLGHYIRRTLKTSSWEKAQAKIRELEESEEPVRVDSRVTIEHALGEYFQDLEMRGLARSSLRKFAGFFQNEFADWCAANSIHYLNEVDFHAIRGFRSTWELNSSRTRHTKQVRIRQFFKFCLRSKWIKENPTDGLSPIRVRQKPTDYFRPHEFERLLDVARESDRLNENRGGVRLAALMLLMRWTGLRISDAVTLERFRVQDGILQLHQMKTGTPVYVPLPPHVLQALRDIPDGMKPNRRYFFWSGNGSREGASDVYSKAFRRVVAKANLGRRVHPHMLRDTFAVELLLAGVPLDQVSILLGHSTVTMTEKHYAPFVKERQNQVVAAVRSAWAAMPSLSGGESGS